MGGTEDVPPTNLAPPRRWSGSTLLASRRARWEKTGSSPGVPLRLASIPPKACHRSGKSIKRKGRREGVKGEGSSEVVLSCLASISNEYVSRAQAPRARREGKREGEKEGKRGEGEPIECTLKS